MKIAVIAEGRSKKKGNSARSVEVLQERRRKRAGYGFSASFSRRVLLFLTGLMVWHGGFGNWGFSLAALWGKPAAVINGESIPRDEFKARMMSVKSAVERQYGKNTFTGERGEALLGALAQEVLDGMLEERLVAQESRKLKIEIRQDRVEEEVQRISTEIYGTWEKFQNRLREDGISPDDFRKHIQNLLLYNAIRAAKTPAGADPEASFDAWLIQAKQKAQLVVYETGNRGRGGSILGGGCCAPGGSTGGSGSPSQEGSSPGSQAENQAKRAALEAYQKSNPAENGVTAKVIDYGCHMQVDIQKDGKVVKSYSYQGGKAFEIS